MRQVARQAGVSIATVSRVFNGGPVGADTRQRIERVAREMRYVPNRAAQSLNTARTHTIGVILPNLYGSFFSELLRQLDIAARESQYHLLVSGSYGGLDELAASLRAMSGRVDALVVMSPVVDPGIIDDNLPPAVPTILLGETLASSGHGAFGVDNTAGAREMTRHLIGLGHRRIAHLRGAEGNRDAADRLEGYREAMHAADLPTDGLVLSGDFTEASGHRAAQSLLEDQALVGASSLPDALFASNDAMAIGAMSAFQDAGLAVPDDIAIAGFDDVPLARYLQPALTSVRVPLDTLTSQAVDHLLAAVRGEPLSPHAVTFPTDLVVRASCGAR